MTTETRITLPNDWTPRPHQLPVLGYFDAGGSRAFTIWHRRAGKDSAALNHTAKSAFERVGTYWHLLPMQRQARKVIWDGIDGQGRRLIDQAFPHELRASQSKTEMRIEFINGSAWQLAGSDNYDSLVGANVLGVVFSEWALADPRAWDYIRPILTENGGWAWFITTPRGKNHAWQLWQKALKQQSWFTERLTVDDTGLITEEQLDQERAEGATEALIRQEYYCSFEAPNAVQFITGEHVAHALARHAELVNVPRDPNQRGIIGVDVARFGNNRSVILERNETEVESIQSFEKTSTMLTAGRVADVIEQRNPRKVFVDGDGIGGAVVDRLHQLGHEDLVVEVRSGLPANDDGRFYNKRAEMWSKTRDWLEHRGALDPKHVTLAIQLEAPGYHYDAKNRTALEKKEDMEKRGVPSPDEADALALTFAEHVGESGNTEGLLPPPPPQTSWAS